MIKSVQIQKTFFPLFIALSGLAGIKLVIGSPWHWAMALSCLALWVLLRPEPLFRTLVSHAAYQLKSPGAWMLFWGGWILFCGGILIAGVLNDGVGIYTVLKYLVLMGVLWLLVVFMPSTGELMRGLYLFALVGLFGLLAVQLGGFNDWLVFPPKRYGWELLPPGVFWKAGIFLIPPLCWILINERSPNILRWSMFFVACIIVGLDGSRTATVLVILIWATCSTLAWIRYSEKNRVVRRGLVIAVWMMVLIGGINPSPWNPVLHIYTGLAALMPDFLSAGSGTGSGVVEVGRDMSSDSIRSAMLMEGLKGVKEHFLFGSGFGTTVAQTEKMAVPVVVHMTYIQVLADTGLAGLIGYFGIFLIPLWYFYRVWCSSEDRWGLFDSKVLPLGIVGIYLFSGLFHPVSNEISEWGVVLPALAMLFRPIERYESVFDS